MTEIEEVISPMTDDKTQEHEAYYTEEGINRVFKADAVAHGEISEEHQFHVLSIEKRPKPDGSETVYYVSAEIINPILH